MIRNSRAQITDYTADSVTLKFENVTLSEIRQLVGDIVSVSIKRWHEKRSDEANRYFHKLVELMARKVGISELEMKNLMISKYGYVDEDLPSIAMKDAIDFTRLDHLHVRPIDGSWNPQAGTIDYVIIRGTHTYDKAEMAKFLNEVVIDAKLLGVDATPPDEVKHLLSVAQQK